MMPIKIKPTNLIEFSNLNTLTEYLDRRNESGVLYNMLIKFLNLFRKKKYYREVWCKVCDGTGKPYMTHAGFTCAEDRETFYRGKCCDGCNGKGSQTVLERCE